MESLSDLASHCIRCGFCLESCPTFMVTGKETESPRGRIYLVRSALEGRLVWEDHVRPHLDACLGCRACETACPSAVQYGRILETARGRLETARPHRARKGLLDTMVRPGLMRGQLALGGLLPGRRLPVLLSRLLSGERPEADKPAAQGASGWAPLDETKLPEVRGEVYLLEGCAMRVLFPRVHEATRRLLRRAGYVVRETSQGCCGALHAHNGHLDEARRLGGVLAESLPDDLPVVVNSAGCGSTMKEYGHLDPENEAMVGIAARTADVSEFLLRAGLTDVLANSQGLASKSATYHDACHLAHGQGVRSAPRELLSAVPGLCVRPLPESDTCCGSAGIYNVTQPKLARALLERKWEHVEATGADFVVLGNPGCHAWIAQAARERGGNVRVFHTAELLEAAFSGLPS
ncbi:MAG: (Fe-S)-binding protein [Fimbriimonadaceae bacterium]|nr:(Fe-S)-binding protein [Fimbriimonadaceae bacterium]